MLKYILTLALVATVLIEESSAVQCPDNERYEECPSDVCGPTKCSEAGFPSACAIRKAGDPCPVNPGCVCADGYLRNKNGICVPYSQCPPVPECKANQQLLKCGLDGCSQKYCKDLYLPQVCNDSGGCSPSCECKEGYLRASINDDTCVPINECPKIDPADY